MAGRLSLRTKVTLLCVTHDRISWMPFATRSSEMDDGRIYVQRRLRLFPRAKSLRQESTGQRDAEEDKNIYRRELEWMRKQLRHAPQIEIAAG